MPSVERFIWVCEEALNRFRTADPNRVSPITYELCEAILKCSEELTLREPPFRWHALLREDIGKKPHEVPFDWQNNPRAFQASILDTCTPWGEHSGHLMSILEETDEASAQGIPVLREVIPNQWRQEGHAAAATALKSWIDYCRGPLGPGVSGADRKVNKRFRVALSFPGDYREFLAKVAESLAGGLGRDRVFYDKYYEAELARPDLDTYLQRIYHDDSELIAVFLCAEYQKKDWCGLEWRAIRDLIKNRNSVAIMPFRFDNTSIPGLFSIDGYVEIAQRSPSDIASLILQRLGHNDQQT
jgi:hypothetical protein